MRGPKTGARAFLIRPHKSVLRVLVLVAELLEERLARGLALGLTLLERLERGRALGRAQRLVLRVAPPALRVHVRAQPRDRVAPAVGLVLDLLAPRRRDRVAVVAADEETRHAQRRGE